jgi:signal transduction histidine kinase
MTPTNGSEAAARRRVISVFLSQGIVSFIALVWVTWLQRDQLGHTLQLLGASAPILIVICLAFAFALALLKFELTNLIFVSLVITACMAFFPLLGGVIAAWTAVFSATLARWMAMKQVGPVKTDMQDPFVEYVKLLGQFGTYGIPVLVAGVLYERLGGEVPLLHTSGAAAMRVAAGGLALIATNLLLMFMPARSYGYSAKKIVGLDLVDGSISLLTLPYAVVTALSFGSLGWGAVLALAFTGVIANLVARNLALTRSRGMNQLQRLASLTNIGKTISLRFTTDQLLMKIYTECKKIVDCSLFTIALLDESTNELSFELDVRENAFLAKDRIPVGEGLNSWVVMNHQPLLIGSVAEERRYGVKAIADTKPTESWLGVPMIARDRVIGVISVESFRKNAFSDDDLLLMTAIANQAAVALENAHLYKDLEGLTYALEQRVMERTNELRETNLRLMAADRSKNQFLANMSHELRTPLNSIIGFSSVLLESTRSLLQPRLYKFLENIHSAGNHLLELINDILDLSKIEAGKMELRADHFDLRETLTAVERVMKGFASEANVRIISTVAPDVPKVRLDEGRLKQILFNLLSNAVKFSPKGGPVHVNVTSVPKAESPLPVNAVRIEVEDDGIGIPPDELKRIFDEFYQTEEGRRSRRGGTGLGLSLTRNFVELHHGRIEVRSAVGQGSCFTMYLPVDYDEAAGTVPQPMLRVSQY